MRGKPAVAVSAVIAFMIAAGGLGRFGGGGDSVSRLVIAAAVVSAACVALTAAGGVFLPPMAGLGLAISWWLAAVGLVLLERGEAGWLVLGAVAGTGAAAVGLLELRHRSGSHATSLMTGPIAWQAGAIDEEDDW